MQHAYNKRPPGSSWRVWAADWIKPSGIVSKRFIVADLKSFYDEMTRVGFGAHSNWYEVVSFGSPVRFHLDIEVERVDLSAYNDDMDLEHRFKFLGLQGDAITEAVDFCKKESAKDWDETQCELAQSFLKSCLSRFMEAHVPDYAGTTVHFLTGCRPKKFSIHVIMPDFVLDRGYMSCRYVAWEFARFMWKEIGNFYLEKEGASKAVMARLMMIHKQAADTFKWHGKADSPVDEGIYDKNRQFRLLGNCKPGTPPLRLIRSQITRLIVSPECGKSLDLRIWRDGFEVMAGWI
jgi:hypothetical protein